MPKPLVFKSRAQAWRYFTERGDDAALKTLHEKYAHLPEYVESAPKPPTPRGYGPLYK
jgi:hypothetical protein